MKANRIFIKFLVYLLFFIIVTPAPITEASTNYTGILSIELDQKSLNMHVDDTDVLNYSYNYKRGYGPDFNFIWSSSNKKVVTVSEGIVTAIAPGNATITLKSGKVKAICKIKVTKTALQKKVDKKIDSVIKSKIKPKMSTVEIVKEIHDYIILTTTYDYDNYIADTIPDVSNTAAGVLLNKKAVCGGYALAFKLFMDKLNIPCKFISGTTVGGLHAWNMVKINGGWYWIDVTWDDPVPDKGTVKYNYFLISDTQLSKDHVWDNKIYSANGTEYLYYVYKDFTINSIKDIPMVVEKQKSKDSLTIVCPVKIKDDLLSSAMRQFSIAKGMSSYYNCYYYEFSVGDNVGYEIYINID